MPPPTAGDAGTGPDGAAVALIEAAALAPDPGFPLPGQPRRPTSLRRVAGSVVLVLMGLSAAYSANAWGLRDRYRPPATYLDGRRPAAVAGQDDGPAAPGAAVAPPAHDIRSQPWWQPVATLAGRGAATTEAFAVDRHALQWRVNWTCTEGSLTAVPVAQGRTGRRTPRPLAQDRCPGQGSGYSVRTGDFAIQVTAAGPWEMTVEQQVDVPLVEAPPPGMDAPEARLLATATVYDVDRVGRGGLRVVALPDGRRVLRLEDFFVSINSDLEIWFSEHPHPRSTPEAALAPHRRLEFLKATVGSMNYEIPAGFDLERYRSVVIWCELTSNAYAAATLQR